MKLYLIRHGETDYNKMKRNQGQIDIPLNEYGRELARKTREGLAEVPFDLCLCSPLSRARETAEIILEGRDIPIITDKRLIEISFGRYEGRCWNPDAWDEEMPRDFQCFFTEPGRYEAPDDGETLEHLEERTGEFLQDICHKKEYQNHTILVSTHGGALASMIANIKKLPKEKFWGDGCSHNCGVTILDVRNGVPVILAEDRIYY